MASTMGRVFTNPTRSQNAYAYGTSLDRTDHTYCNLQSSLACNNSRSKQLIVHKPHS